MDAIAAMGMKGRGLTKGVAQIKGVQDCSGGFQERRRQAGSTALPATSSPSTKANTRRSGAGGDGSTDLDLFVVDKDGRIVASDLPPRRLLLGRVCARNETEYQVMIVNWGAKANKFSLVFN